MLKVYDVSVSFVEVPIEQASLTIFVSGCPRKCKSCSWENLSQSVYDLSIEEFENLLIKKQGKCTCVCFLGGEWNNDFIDYLKIANNKGFKTCLYTGADVIEDIDSEVLQILNYIKTGHYDESKGNLHNPQTNQKFYELNGGRISNEVKFWEVYQKTADIQE